MALMTLNLEATGRLFLAVCLAFFLPGFALTAAALPSNLRIEERLTLSVGLSLALAALGGLLLNWTPWGLTAASWASFLVAVTLLGIAVALGRTRRRPAVRVRGPSIRAVIVHGLLFALAGSVLAASLMGARRGAEQQTQAGFTQLWLVPLDETREVARLGIRSQELEEATYQLRLESGERLLHHWPAIKLEPGQQWETEVVVQKGAGEALVASLGRSEFPAAEYRRAFLRFAENDDVRLLVETAADR